MSKKSPDPDAVCLVKNDLKDIKFYYEQPKHHLEYEKIYGTPHKVIALADKYLEVASNAPVDISYLYVEVIVKGCTQKGYADYLGCNINRVHRTYKKMINLFVKAFYEPDQNTPSNDK